MTDIVSNGGERPIKFVFVAYQVLMNAARPNGGEGEGNVSPQKVTNDGRAYVSGQKQRHTLAEAMRGLMEGDPAWENYILGNADGVLMDILRNLRADMFGHLELKKREKYGARRNSPISSSLLISTEPVIINRDLLVRINQDPGRDPKIATTLENADRRETSRKANQKKDAGSVALADDSAADASEEPSKQDLNQAIAHVEFFTSALMNGSFGVEVGRVGGELYPIYRDQTHVGYDYIKAVDDAGHRARIKLFLEATQHLSAYSSQARNATGGTPQRVLLVLDPILSRKALRYWESATTAIERKRIVAELEGRGAEVIFGDDTDESQLSIAEAYKKAQEILSTRALYRPTQSTVS